MLTVRQTTMSLPTVKAATAPVDATVLASTALVNQLHTQPTLATFQRPTTSLPRQQLLWDM